MKHNGEKQFSAGLAAGGEQNKTPVDPGRKGPMNARQEEERRTLVAFRAAGKGEKGNPTEAQVERERTGAAFAAAMKSGTGHRANPDAPRAAGCNPTARQKQEAETAKAFKRALAATPAKLAAVKLALFGPDWDKLVAAATPAERAAAARKLATIFNDPKPGAERG